MALGLNANMALGLALCYISHLSLMPCAFFQQGCSMEYSAVIKSMLLSCYCFCSKNPEGENCVFAYQHAIT